MTYRLVQILPQENLNTILNLNLQKIFYLF